MPRGSFLSAHTWIPRWTIPSPPTTTSASRWRLALTAASYEAGHDPRERSLTWWPLAASNASVSSPQARPLPDPEVGLVMTPTLLIRAPLRVHGPAGRRCCLLYTSPSPRDGLLS